MDARPYSEIVAERGLAPSHRRMLEAVPGGARVLDIGCAGGYVAAALKQRGCVVVGIDPDATSAAAAREHCEKVVVGDFEDPAVRAQLGTGFDVVLMGDVLEHLRDPWTALAATQELLGPGGRVVASIPNIGHWSARLAILRGNFDYADSGLFDRTHLRFFTRRTAHELADRAGFVVEHEALAEGGLPGDASVAGRLAGRAPAVRLPRGLRPFVARNAPGLFTLQFVLTLAPARSRGATSRD